MSADAESQLRELLEREVLDADGGLRDRVYVIESPSPEDLLHARNEGDALCRILRLGDIDVSYFLAANAEMFEEAFEAIGLEILNQPNVSSAMPFIHISAHGSPDGVELTDGDVIYWDKLSSLFADLGKLIGSALMPPPLPQGLPKAVLCLSSCGVFDHYKAVAPAPPPFQALVAPVRDVGWCEALIAYSTFYYLVNVLRKSFTVARVSMNIAAGAIFGEGEVYKIWTWEEAQSQ